MTKAVREALKTIAGYVLPVYTIDGKKYVKFEHADFLRKTAQQALDGQSE